MSKHTIECKTPKNRVPWNKGLTKETSLSLKKISLSLTGRKLSEDHKKKCGDANRGRKHTEERKSQLIKVLLEKGVKTRFKKGENISIKTQFKKGFVPWNKGKKMPEISGKNHPRWKGGYDKKNSIRKSLEYKLWRKAVFERDKFTCIWCGDNKGGNLEADHIKPFAYFPEIRFAIDNGRTLCKTCHKKTDTYGGKGFKRIKKII